ncbi:hypothetical protein Tco_1204205 [Tanacetum coccineum]
MRTTLLCHKDKLQSIVKCLNQRGLELMLGETEENLYRIYSEIMLRLITKLFTFIELKAFVERLGGL